MGEVVARDILGELLERRMTLADQKRREEIDPTLELLFAGRETPIRGRIVCVVVFERVE